MSNAVFYPLEITELPNDALYELRNGDYYVTNPPHLGAQYDHWARSGEYSINALGYAVSAIAKATRITVPVGSADGKTNKMFPVIDPDYMRFLARGLFLQDMGPILVPLLRKEFGIPEGARISDWALESGNQPRSVLDIKLDNLQGFKPHVEDSRSYSRVSPLNLMYYVIANMFRYLEIELMYETRSPDQFLGVPMYMFRLWRIKYTPSPKMYRGDTAYRSGRSGDQTYHHKIISLGKRLAQEMVQAIFKGRRDATSYVEKNGWAEQKGIGTEFMAFAHSACIPAEPVGGERHQIARMVTPGIYEVSMSLRNSLPLLGQAMVSNPSRYYGQTRAGSDTNQLSCMYLRMRAGAGQDAGTSIFHDARFAPSDVQMGELPIECSICASLGFFSPFGCPRGEIRVPTARGMGSMQDLFPLSMDLRILRGVSPLTPHTISETPLVCSSCNYKGPTLGAAGPYVFLSLEGGSSSRSHQSTRVPRRITKEALAGQLSAIDMKSLSFRCPSCQGEMNNERRRLGNSGVTQSTSGIPTGCSELSCTICNSVEGRGESGVPNRYLVLYRMAGVSDRYVLFHSMCEECFCGHVMLDPGMLSRFRIVKGTTTAFRDIMHRFFTGVSAKELDDIITSPLDYKPGHSLSRCSSGVSI